jgi:nicotinamidase-related amidase
MPDALSPVIVIDLQTGMFNGVLEPPLKNADALVPNAKAVIAWARATGHPLAFVRHDGPGGDPLAPGEPGWPIWPELGQAPDEPTFGKSVGDAFSNPALGVWVGDAAEVVLVGAQTENCVAATVQGALGRGLKVTVVGDAHGTWDADGETADQIIARKNADFEAAGASVVGVAGLTGGAG